MKFPIFILLFLTFISGKQTDPFTVTGVRPVLSFGKQTTLSMDQWQHLPNGDSLRISQLRYYLSTPGGDWITLVDLKENKSITPPIYQKSVMLGIDSITHEQYSLKGDLDPMQGMYWTWKSGYIFFKLEGEMIRNGTYHAISLHLGGYQWPNNSCFVMENISLDGVSILNLDLKPLFETLPDGSWQVMSPGTESRRCLRILSESFTTRP